MHDVALIPASTSANEDVIVPGFEIRWLGDVAVEAQLLVRVDARQQTISLPSEPPTDRSAMSRLASGAVGSGPQSELPVHPVPQAMVQATGRPVACLGRKARGQLTAVKS
jgi:hypothetical protein